ncbi:MAG: hypothetical protein CFH44_00424 [Proteobacteria bacterium]|nr:MAG: hypothetical protein CFH44_00424 [Pseudomonadota bacterium]
MKKLILILTAIIISYNSAIASTSGRFAIEHHTNSDNITYNLPITAEFKNAFESALKTGKVVSIVHKVKIRPVDQWIGWLAEKKYTKYYKYNLINNQYYIGVKKDKLRPTASAKNLFNNATGLINAPFLPKNVLQKGNAYEIDFTISINPIEEESSSKFLLFKGEGLKERLHSAVHYIDK